MTNRAKHWVFTLNNPDEEAELIIYGLKVLNDCVQYIVAGKEVGDSGTPHFQGYISLTDKKYLQFVKDLFYPLQPHLEIARGTPLEASNYCKKGSQTHAEWSQAGTNGLHYGVDADFFEDGTLPLTGAQATKENWAAVKACAQSNELDNIDPEIYIKHYHTLRAIAKDNLVMPPDAPDVTGIWIMGPAGCGKSRMAREDYRPYYAKLLNKWWDGYKGEPYVIMDDLDPTTAKYLTHHIKIWCDRYGFNAEIKGGALAIRPLKFIITSQYSIAECFTGVDTDAVIRRCQVINLFVERTINDALLNL
jgi:hypothetical protein